MLPPFIEQSGIPHVLLTQWAARWGKVSGTFGSGFVPLSGLVRRDSLQAATVRNRVWIGAAWGSGFIFSATAGRPVQ